MLGFSFSSGSGIYGIRYRRSPLCSGTYDSFGPCGPATARRLKGARLLWGIGDHFILYSVPQPQDFLVVCGVSFARAFPPREAGIYKVAAKHKKVNAKIN